MMMTIEEFCDQHDASEEFREWVDDSSESIETMTDVWDGAPPEYFAWVASRPGVMSEEETDRLHRFCYGVRKTFLFVARSMGHPVFDVISPGDPYIADMDDGEIAGLALVAEWCRFNVTPKFDSARFAATR